MAFWAQLDSLDGRVRFRPEIFGLSFEMPKGYATPGRAYISKAKTRLKSVENQKRMRNDLECFVCCMEFFS